LLGHHESIIFPTGYCAKVKSFKRNNPVKKIGLKNMSPALTTWKPEPEPKQIVTAPQQNYSFFRDLLL
jgi:hypothetical protein